MSVENFKNFITKIKTDKVLQENLKETGTDVDKIIALGKETGFEFTAEDMDKAVEELKMDGEISDEQLDNVSGGINEGDDVVNLILDYFINLMKK